MGCCGGSQNNNDKHYVKAKHDIKDNHEMQYNKEANKIILWIAIIIIAAVGIYLIK